MGKRDGGTDASQRTPNTTSFLYDFGSQLGRITRLMLVVFVLSIGGLVVAGETIPGPARVAITILCCFFGGLAALVSSIGRRQPILFFGGTYILTVALGFSLQIDGSRSTPAIVAVTAGTLVSAIGVVASLFIIGRKSRELERLLFSDATSAAFFITMLGAITYGLLEVWLGFPKLSMWLVWSVGMGSWGLLSVILQRRYT